MYAKHLIVLVLTVLANSGQTINADEIEGIHFPKTRRVEDKKLILNNVGLMRYNIVIKAMVAGLYLGEGVQPNEVLSDVPKRIEIHYFWSLKKTDIVDASEKLLIANVSGDRIQAIRGQIDEMNKLYEDIKAGDRYALTYLPGIGTELALNGERKGIVKGKEFARSYFAIWLGKKPMDIALRDELTKVK